MPLFVVASSNYSQYKNKKVLSDEVHEGEDLKRSVLVVRVESPGETDGGMEEYDCDVNVECDCDVNVDVILIVEVKHITMAWAHGAK